jgi:quercetin dioxygenase-like cupin family protein
MKPHHRPLVARFARAAARLTCITLALATSASGQAAPQNPTAPAPLDWSPSAIAWQRVNPDGTRFALLEGVRDTAGVAFSYAFFIPAGVWDGAHHHSADARIFVAQGTLVLGYGDKMDRSKARAYPKGSFLLVPAGAVHFDGSDEDTVIFGTAVGPWATQYVAADAKPSAGSPLRPR